MGMEKIKEIRNLIDNFIEIMYKQNPEDKKIQKDFFSSMSDESLLKYVKKNDITVIVKPFSEPTLEDLEKFSKFLGCPLDEKVYFPNLNNYVTERPVPVGYASIKFLEQLAVKKITQSHKVDEINIITGGQTQNSKTRSFTAPESISTFSYGVEKEILNEFFRARADDRVAAEDMERQIAENGTYYQKNMSTQGIGQLPITLNYFLLGAGIETDIVPDVKVSIDGKSQDIR